MQCHNSWNVRVDQRSSSVVGHQQPTGHWFLMPVGHLSLVTIGRVDQRQTLVKAITFQLMCFHFQWSAAVKGVSLSLIDQFVESLRCRSRLSLELFSRQPIQLLSQRLTAASDTCLKYCAITPTGVYRSDVVRGMFSSAVTMKQAILICWTMRISKSMKKEEELSLMG